MELVLHRSAFFGVPLREMPLDLLEPELLGPGKWSGVARRPGRPSGVARCGADRWRDEPDLPVVPERRSARAGVDAARVASGARRPGPWQD